MSNNDNVIKMSTFYQTDSRNCEIFPFFFNYVSIDQDRDFKNADRKLH